jgi:chromosome segregation ATPase
MDWLPLIIVFLLGMLVEWLLEMWFFRRRFRKEVEVKEREFTARLSARDKELADVRAQIGTLQGDVNTLTGTRADLESKLADANAQLNAAASARAAAESQLQAREEEFGELRANLVALRPDEDKDKDLSIPGLAALAAGALGADAAIKQKDEALDAANARVNELQADVEALSARKAELESQLQTRETELADLTARLIDLQSDFDKARQAAAVELAALTAGAATASARIKRTEADLHAANAQLAALQTEADALAAAKDDLEATSRSLGAHLAESRNSLTSLQARFDEARKTASVELAALAAGALATEEILKGKNEALDEAYRQVAAARDEIREQERARIGAEIIAQNHSRQLEEATLRFGALQESFDKTRAASAIELAALAAGSAATAAAIRDKEGALDEAYRQIAALQTELDTVGALRAETDTALHARESELSATRAQLKAYGSWVEELRKSGGRRP